MNIIKTFVAIMTLALLINGCEKEAEIDTHKPVIDMSISTAFPIDCDTLYFGESFTFMAKFSDNVELGSTNAFSLDIHHNFDHHSHSTQPSQCHFDADKGPVNPFVYLESFSIPEGVNEYIAEVSIQLPKSNAASDYEEGDYHFFISLTDKEGWSTQRGMNIKMLHR